MSSLCICELRLRYSILLEERDAPASHFCPFGQQARCSVHSSAVTLVQSRLKGYVSGTPVPGIVICATKRSGGRSREELCATPKGFPRSHKAGKPVTDVGRFLQVWDEAQHEWSVLVDLRSSIHGLQLLQRGPAQAAADKLVCGGFDLPV